MHRIQADKTDDKVDGILLLFDQRTVVRHTKSKVVLFSIHYNKRLGCGSEGACEISLYFFYTIKPVLNRYGCLSVLKILHKFIRA